MPQTSPPHLTRSSIDRRIAGVCGGLGRYLGVDPVIVRIVFVIAAVAGGTGIVAYLAAWVLMPEGDSTGIVAPAPGAGLLGSDAARITGAAVLAVGVLSLFGGWDWADDLFVPALLIGGGIWLLRRPVDLESRWRPDATAATVAAADLAEDEDESDPWTTPWTPGQKVPDVGAALTSPPPPPRVSTAPTPTVVGTRPRGRTGQITVGVLALLAGGVGVAAAAGAAVDLETVLLACLGVTALGLLVGAFSGGARGLIGIAIPLVLALVVVRAVDLSLNGGIGSRLHEPATVSELQPIYRLGIGELHLDLTGLDADELPRRTHIEVRVGMGQLAVVVPDDVRVEVDARVTVGDLTVFGRHSDGTDLRADEVRSAPEGSPVVELEIVNGVGEVTVR